MALTKVTGQVIKDTTDVTVGVLTVTNTLAVGGTVSIGGTLTYEDVTNVDAVGLITARNGIVVGSGITLSKDGDGFFTGVITATSYSGIDLSDVTGATGDFSIADKIVHTGDTNTALRFPAADTITAETGGSERLRINSDGEVLVNHTAAVGSGQIQSYTSNSDAIDIAAYSTTAGNGGRLTFYRSKNATIGSNTEVADNDSLGRIDWRGYNDDGTAYNIGATIEAEVDGAVDSTTDMPSALVFKTSADGSSSPTERARIDSSGLVGIGENTPATILHVKGNYGDMLRLDRNNTGAVGNQIAFRHSNSGTLTETGSINCVSTANADTGQLRFSTKESGGSVTEKVRITSDGKLGLGTNNPSQLMELSSTAPNIRLTDTVYGYAEIDGNSSDLKFNADKGDTKSDSTITFFVDNTERARIDSSGNLKFNAGYGSVKEAYGVRAWANYDHVAATIRGSAQLTSVTDTSTGRGTFNWAFTFVDQYYAAVGTSGGGGGTLGDDNAVTWASSDHGTTSLSFRTDNFKTNANHDSDNLNVIIVR